MRVFTLEWETDFCDDFPEVRGTTTIEANTEAEALEKYKALRNPKTIVFNIY